MAIEANLEGEIIDLEKQFWQAMKDQDVSTAIRLTDFPVLLSGPQGIGRVDEPAFRAMFADPHYKLEAFELGGDAQVRLVGDDVAIVAYKAHEELSVDGEHVSLDVADTSTWVRRDGRWACAQHTEAIVGDPFGRDRTPTAAAGKEPGEKLEERKDQPGITTFTTPSDRELVATRVFDAPRELVWQMCTRTEHVPRWMLGPEGWSMPICEIDLRPGGTWHFVWRHPQQEEMEMHGEYREVVAPERIVNTESWGGDWADTLNALVFIDDNGKTRLECTVTYPSKAERERAISTGMKEGWSVSYDRLDGYLKSLRAPLSSTVTM